MPTILIIVIVIIIVVVVVIVIVIVVVIEMGSQATGAPIFEPRASVRCSAAGLGRTRYASKEWFG